jgi:hypothetical protein
MNERGALGRAPPRLETESQVFERGAVGVLPLTPGSVYGDKLWRRIEGVVELRLAVAQCPGELRVRAAKPPRLCTIELGGFRRFKVEMHTALSLAPDSE